MSHVTARKKKETPLSKKDFWNTFINFERGFASKKEGLK